MNEYTFARNLAIAWLQMNKIPVKETATSMRIARLLKCWDGKAGAKAAKAAIVIWHEKALTSSKSNKSQVKADEFYSSQAWRSVRYEALKRSRGCCELCGATPEKAALHVDHIAPRSKYPLLALEVTNLQVLCKDCNLGKGNKDSIDWRNNRN